jgi:hypothetical protein
MAAMSMRGRVVITFFVHRNGALTDVTVFVLRNRLVQHGRRERAAGVESDAPLPPEYPTTRRFSRSRFTNESPPGES